MSCCFRGSRAVCVSPWFVRATRLACALSRAIRTHRLASFAHGHTWLCAIPVCPFAHDAVGDLFSNAMSQEQGNIENVNR
jgi:hypothetical protein